MKKEYSKDVLRKVFDESMVENIIRFANEIMASDADLYIVMARKAACFIQFLQRCGLLRLDNRFITDRLLDVEIETVKDKRVIIVDDVIVSGTTVYRVIEKLKAAQVESVEVYVLGVTEDVCNKDIFAYQDSDNNTKSYIHAPYVSLTEATCIRTCSNIVTSFLLDITPYDVDFPRHAPIEIGEQAFNCLVNNPNWRSYDVASAIQSQYSISNITIIPDEAMQKRFDENAGVSVSEMGFFKIRIFARKAETKSKPYIVNIVPYYLFNSIDEEDVERLFVAYFGHELDETPLTSKCKIRLLQYVFSSKLLQVWLNDYNAMFNRNLILQEDRASFKWIFPAASYLPVRKAIAKKISVNITGRQLVPNIGIYDSNTKIDLSEFDNTAVIKTVLMNPFVKLYHETEIEARELVRQHGKSVFNNPAYTRIIDRLTRGYSFLQLIALLKDLPDGYDRHTMVSLFLDEAIDVGIVVPIIQQQTINDRVIFYRAYRHGEDVPFGEEEEKMCAILLKRLQDNYGTKMLTNLNVEKLLVLFLNIGMSNNLFSFTPGDQPLYKVNVCSYLHGNVPIVGHPVTNDPSSQMYLVHRTDAVWLVDKLIDKKIIITKTVEVKTPKKEETKEISTTENADESVIGALENAVDDYSFQSVEQKNKKYKIKYERIEDPINLDIDSKSRGKIEMISTTFGLLLDNRRKKIEPSIDSWDLVLFSTCITPKDIINAMAAELAITADRWTTLRRDCKFTGDKLVAEYKKDNMYYSVNSGKKKYLSFMNHEPEKRIKEISNALESNPEVIYRLYAEVWNTFWPNDYTWNKDSIGAAALSIINQAGVLLIWYNIIYRLLFACYSTEKEEQFKWLNEARTIFKEEMPHEEYRSSFVQNMNKIMYRITNDLNTNKSLVQYQGILIKGIENVNSRKRFDLMQKIELFIDRHGKQVPINNWGTMIYLPIKSPINASVMSTLSSYLERFPKDIQLLPAAETKNHLEGIWILFRAKSESKKNLPTILDYLTTAICASAYVFTDLEDGLYVFSSTVENTQYKYGNFWEYVNIVINEANQIITKPRLSSNINIVVSQINVGTRNSDASILLPQKQWTTLSKPNYSVVYDKYFDSKTKLSVYSRYGKETTVMELMDWYKSQSNRMNIFISYAVSEDKKASLLKIVDALRNYEINPYFYEDEVVGCDMVEFMRRCESVDFVLIIGSKEYVAKATTTTGKSSGVQFEDRIISSIYSSEKRNHIIPIIIGDGSFADLIPSPYNRLKGIQLKNDTDEVLSRELVAPLLKAYKAMLEQLSMGT